MISKDGFGVVFVKGIASLEQRSGSVPESPAGKLVTALVMPNLLFWAIRLCGTHQPGVLNERRVRPARQHRGELPQLLRTC